MGEKPHHSCWEDDLVERLHNVLIEGLQEALWLGSQIRSVLNEENNNETLSKNVRNKIMPLLHNAVYKDLDRVSSYIDWLKNDSKSENGTLYSEIKTKDLVTKHVKLRFLSEFKIAQNEKFLHYIWNCLAKEVQSMAKIDVTIQKVNALHNEILHKIHRQMANVDTFEIAKKYREEKSEYPI